MNTKSVVRYKINLMYKTESLQMHRGSQYPPFFNPRIWFIGMRDLYTFCPEYNTKKRRRYKKNEDDQDSYIREFNHVRFVFLKDRIICQPRTYISY